ncbi:PAS-PAC-PAC sensing histidine kinase [Halorubrum aidingense JCM 13560]|uniref:histidine kinase n=1 Tax=Halorubrum aidingense JCM 13560 TaxID=1230454 RepID=M0PJA7_9EURY|nr:PAS domain S-box protein [Halorubrum aidingense]EMA68840.1 PAS-PAC-PAC sensing histidine kinase [Halorubrum aidingense JCM 13560]
MSDEEPPFAGEGVLGTSTDSDKILLLVQGQRNQDLLADLLNDYEVAVAAPDADEPLPEFDLCIVGEENYRAFADTLRSEKENAGERYLPVLLLVGERGGHETSQRLRGVADDTLHIPAPEAVVRSRVESLLRTRRQSLQLALYRRAMDDSTAGIAIADADNDQPLTYVNDAFVEISGYNREEVLGRNCRFLQGEETDPESVQRLHDAIDAGETVSVELRNYRKDGTEFWNHLEIAPVYDHTGELTHYIGFQSDVTARRQAEERLREETETLERLFETSPVGITVLNTDGQVVRANGAAEEVLGLERSDVVGRTFDEPSWEIVDENGESVDSEDLPFSRVMATGETVRGYEHGIAEGGETRWLSINAAPLNDESGERISVITTIEDITERRAQERELERLIDLLDQTQAIGDIGGWEIDTEDGKAEFTKGLAELFGVWPQTKFDLDEAFGFYHPADEPKVRDVFERLVATGEPQEIDCRIQTASGETRWTHVRGKPHQSEPSVYRGTVQDVTERRERERELKETKELLQSVFDASPIGILAVDKDGITQLWSEGCERIFGWSDEEAIGEPLPNIQPEMRAEFDELRNEVIEGKDPVIGYETVRQRRDGSLVDVALTTAPMRDSDDEIIGVVGLLEDITDRKERQQELKRYERIVETTNDLIYTLDENLAFTSFNTAMAQFVGLPQDAITGEHLSTAFGYEYADVLADAATKILAEETTETTVETTLVTHRGEKRKYQTTVSVGMSDQKVEELVCVGRDITELQERERRLSVFDRVLRHNLRNKMNVIQGWSDRLIDGPTQEETADIAAKIQEASDELLNLSRLVREFDTVSDPAASELIKTMDVARHIEEIASEAKLSYPTASISVETPPIAEAEVHEAFELAVNELVDNAVKHSGERPSIHLSVTIDDEADAVVVRVADDGPGIPDLERRSITAGRESPLEHTNGLGLWFVRWMATNSGGSMQIKDNEPTGAVVELRFLRQ